MKKQSEMDAFHGRKEETPDASNAEVSSVSEDGAGGGTRTHTVSPPTDFESVTSTIPSHRREVYYSGKLIRIQVKFQNLPQKSEKHPPKSQIPLVISGNLE